MVGAWHGHGMPSVNQTQPHCVNQMGKTHSKPLAVRHDRGKAWARHGNGMLCVNRPLRLNHKSLVVVTNCACFTILYFIDFNKLQANAPGSKATASKGREEDTVNFSKHF